MPTGRKKYLAVVMVGIVTIFGVNGVVHAGQEENRKQLVTTNSCPGCDLSGVNLDRLQMQGANLEGANLSQAKVRLSSLAKANLRRANLQNAQFGGSDLADADLRGARIQGATFVGAYVVGVQLDKGVALDQSSAEPVAVAEQAVTEKKSSAPAVAKTPAASAPASAPPAEEPGLLDKTWSGLTGLFGSGGGDAEKGDAVSTTKKEAPVAAEKPAVEKPAVAVQDQGKAAAPEEPGLLDKTWSGLTGLFGQDEGDGQQKASVPAEKQERPADAVPPVASAPPSAPVKAVAEKPAVEKPVVAVQGQGKVAAPEEPGLLDKTWSGLTGLFVADEEEAQPKEAAPAEKTVVSTADEGVVDRPIPVPVPTTVAPVPVAPIAPAPIANEPPAEIAESVVLEGEPDVPPAPAVALMAGKKEAGVQEKTEKKTDVVQAKEQKKVADAPAVVASATPVPPVSEAGMQVTKEKNRLRALDSRKCYGCDLQGVDFAGKNLSGVDFEGADLTGSNLAGADLEEGNLKGAVLVGANLKGADLRGADLYKANLSKADLTGANLKDALLDDAQFVDTIGYKP